MSGQVLNGDRDLLVIAERANSECWEVQRHVLSTDVPNLIATIRDRDKTIAELREKLAEACEAFDHQSMTLEWANKENAMMLDVLERMANTNHDDPHWYMEQAEVALAKVKDGAANG